MLEWLEQFDEAFITHMRKKLKFSVKYFCNKCEQIPSFQWPKIFGFAFSDEWFPKYTLDTRRKLNVNKIFRRPLPNISRTFSFRLVFMR